MHNWQNGWVKKVLIHLWWKRQIAVDSVGSGSNLNYSCLIVCSLFFPKIFSRYISTYLIRNTWFGGDTSRFGRWPRAPTPERVKTLAKSWLIITEVMSICVIRGVQPLQYRGKPMWHSNGEDDASRCGCKGPDSAKCLARILSELYKGQEEEFLRIKPQDGFSMMVSLVDDHPRPILRPIGHVHFPNH